MRFFAFSLGFTREIFRLRFPKIETTPASSSLFILRHVLYFEKITRLMPQFSPKREP